MRGVGFPSKESRGGHPRVVPLTRTEYPFLTLGRLYTGKKAQSQFSVGRWPRDAGEAQARPQGRAQVFG